jgi:hypothetical protein
VTDLVKDLVITITDELRPLLKDNPDRVEMTEWLKKEYSRYMMVSSDDYIDSANSSIEKGIWVDILKCLVSHLGKYGSTQAIFRASISLYEEFTLKEA